MKTIQFKNSSISYNPETGEFKWITCFRKPWMDGQLATHKTPNGYLYIKADGRNHSASRLSWQLFNNQPIPDGMEIDHINRIKTDNRPINLRVVDRKGNLANSIKHPGETGHLGVSIYRRPSGCGFMYRARHLNKTTYHDTLEEAIAGRAQLLEDAGYAKLGAEACE